MKPETVSLDKMMDKARVNTPTGSLDKLTEREEAADRIEGTLVSIEAKKIREAETGLTDSERDSLADEFLKQHGFGDDIDPDLK